MTFDWIEALGGVAATITTAAYVPQVVKAWRTRQTRDISLIMFAMVSTGIVLWLIYGLLIGSWPLIGANIVTLALTLQVLWLKLRHG